MNKLLYYPLVIMFVLTVFNQFYQYSTAEKFVYNGTSTINPTTGEIISNGSSTTFETGGTNIDFSLNLTTGFIALIIGVVALGVVIGISVLGSNLSERSQRIIFTSAIAYGLWGVFSALTYTMFAGNEGIPLFGSIGWLAFTGVYTIGFFKEVNGGTN